MTRQHPTIPANEIIAAATVRKLCGGINRNTLLRWRAGRIPRAWANADTFPQPVRKTDGVELWDARQIRAWLKTLPNDPRTTPNP